MNQNRKRMYDDTVASYGDEGPDFKRLCEGLGLEEGEQEGVDFSVILEKADRESMDSSILDEDQEEQSLLNEEQEVLVCDVMKALEEEIRIPGSSTSGCITSSSFEYDAADEQLDMALSGLGVETTDSTDFGPLSLPEEIDCTGSLDSSQEGFTEFNSADPFCSSEEDIHGVCFNSPERPLDICYLLEASDNELGIHSPHALENHYESHELHVFGSLVDEKIAVVEARDLVEREPWKDEEISWVCEDQQVAQEGQEWLRRAVVLDMFMDPFILGSSPAVEIPSSRIEAGVML